MTRGEMVSLPVGEIAAGGAGMAEYRGERIFVPLAAPGDRVRLRIAEAHRGWARGELLEVLEASPLRADPVCPHYGACGGCSLQHLSYEAQVTEKRRILAEAFRRIGGREAPLPRVFSSPPWEYRNRMQFHRVSPAGGRGLSRRRGRFRSGAPLPRGPFLGLKARQSGDLVPLGDCPVADPGIRAALRGGTLVPPVEKDRFTVYSRGKTLLSAGGEDRGRVLLRDKELWLEAGVFFQSNGGLLEMVIGRLLELARGADTGLPLADLYAGVGTFAAFLGETFSRTDLVEENPRAQALARRNLSPERAAFYPLAAEDWVKNRSPGPYGFMVLDPPRTGLSPALRDFIARDGPPLLAYVSCDPASLARDSGEIAAGGYELEELDLYDFYPQTAHIESLAVFRRRGGRVG